MQDGEPTRPSPEAPAPLPLFENDVQALAKNPKAFAAHVRNDLHLLLKKLAAKDWEGALTCLSPLEGEPSWTPTDLEKALAPYFAEHAFIDFKPQARLPHNTLLKADGEGRWEAIQKIVDPEGEADWMLDCIVALSARTTLEAPLISLRRVGV